MICSQIIGMQYIVFTHYSHRNWEILGDNCYLVGGKMFQHVQAQELEALALECEQPAPTFHRLWLRGQMYFSTR